LEINLEIAPISIRGLKLMHANVGIRLLASLAVAACLLAANASLGLAVPMTITDPGLSGNTQADAWTNASLVVAANPGYGGFPGSAAWPGPINSITPTVGTNGDAQLNRLAGGALGGGPVPVTGSIYFGSFDLTANVDGGKLGVSDATPLANVANVVYQIQIGEATGFDFLNAVKPVLNYNGGSQALAATNLVVLEQVQNGSFNSPAGPQPIFINTYLLQWNTTALGPITSLSITFNAVQHAQLYQLRLDQSDVFVSVPEPASATLAGMALLGAFGLAWKKRRAR
jgi:hypothetical protein